MAALSKPAQLIAYFGNLVNDVTSVRLKMIP